jgi:hypothetical protein
MCGGSQNMMCYVYAYNINGYTCFQTAKVLGKKQTNVYELEKTITYIEGNCQLPRRRNENSIDLVEPRLRYKTSCIQHRNSGLLKLGA